jgi:hypothetical protein
MTLGNQAFHVSVVIDEENVSSRMATGVEGSAFPSSVQWRSQLKELSDWPIYRAFQLCMENPP